MPSRKPLLQRCPTCVGATWVICPTCRGNRIVPVNLPRRPLPPEPSEAEVREARQLMRLEA